MTEPFHVLVVCSGNVCRSPLAERLLRARLDAALGPRARRIVVVSAGTAAMVGSAMDDRAAAVGLALDADPGGFVARTMTVADVAGADLVLGAAREHRAAAVRLHPAAHRYAFTLPEFARLAAAVPPGELPGPDPADRARALVAAAGSRRGVVRAERPEDDDVPDPRGGPERVHRTVGVAIERAVVVLVDLLAGRDPELAAATAPLGRRPAGARRARAGGPGDRGGRDRGGPDDRGGRDRGGPGERGGSGDTRRPAGGRRRPARRPHRVRRALVRSGLGVLVVLVLGAGWLALRGTQAQRELTAARADITGVRTAALAGDLDRARVSLADAQRRTSRARSLTGDPVWRVAAGTPWVGANPGAVRTVAASVDDLSHGALPALLGAAAALDPAGLRPAGDRVSVDAFTRTAPVVAAAGKDVAAASVRLGGLATGGLLPPVADAVDALQAELADTSATLAGVARASRLVPAMFGGGAKRRYLVVFQNNAEARATGGLVGAYAVVTVEQGRLRVEKIGSNTDLRNARTLPVDLGPDFRSRWGDAPALWVNGNLDANFPSAARIWTALWKRQTGQGLDGVVATDPVALSYLLAATGPVRLPSGESISTDNAVRLTMSDVYARSKNNSVRDEFLRSVAGAVVEALTAGRGEPRALLDQLSRAAGERRLLVYSTHPAEQKELTATVLAGVVSRASGPYAFVVVNNAGGNKMDYYLQRTIRYEAGSCAGTRRASRLTVTFGNAAPDPARLPVYVSQRLDDARGTRSQSTSDGAVVELVSVYGPLEGGVVRATLDGKPLAVTSGRSGSRPVWTFPLVVEHGKRRTVVLDLDEPASTATPVVPVQPLVLPASVSVSRLSCR